MTDPLHQFQIHVIAPLFRIGGVQFNFTNASVFMLLIVALVCTVLYAAFARPELVPSRLQSVGEIWYDFVHNMVRQVMGEDGMKFFPLVFTIFSFVQDLFPSTDPAVNKINFRIGLDGSKPPGGDADSGLSDAGGTKPDVRCFNEVGTYLNLEVNDGNKCDSGSEACSTEVQTDNACSYSLFTANNDAICIGWMSITFPGGDEYGSPIGEWAEFCDANHGTGGAW